MSLTLAVYVVVVALLPVGSVSQEAAVCSVPELNWMFNSAGQSPCQVATTLAVDCSDTGFYLIPKLPPRSHYLGPPFHDSCQCNTVFYSLLSACAACQNAGWISWLRFAVNCTLSYTSEIPLPLPHDVKVPGWAYADIELTSNNFSLAAAQNLAQSPESTGVPLSTPTSIMEPSMSSSSISSTSTSTTASASASESSSHAGIIAGSVVGGVVGLSLIAALLVYFLRRHRLVGHPKCPEEPSAPAPPTYDHPSQTIEPYTPAPYNPNTGEYYSGSFAAAFPSHKFYEPPESVAFPLPAPTLPGSVGVASPTSDTVLMDPRPGQL